MAKFIFVTGGVVSGLGKGITAASIGRLLKSRGISVSIMKLDPYVNVDAGTMSPLQHGEVFVTEDGAETDLDLGHYERFIDINLGRHFNVTTGQIYKSVITRERRGDFLGGTVQVVPHVTNEIKACIQRAADESATDVVIVEIGGTVGDIEGLPFLEAIRQFKNDVPRDDVIYLHVTLVPYLNMSGEQKTKPTQHSVRELRSIGIQPNIIVCRTEQPMSAEMRAKIALFCDTEPDAVVQNLDAASIYEVPLLLEAEGLGNLIVRMLKIDCEPPRLDEWEEVVHRIRHPEHKVKIALVGKYVALHDAYLSVVEALNHGGIANDVEVLLEWVDAEGLESKDLAGVFSGVDGVLVPGGFGHRGVEGKIAALKHARTNRIPALGLCLGMQCMLIEAARNVLGLSAATSTEFDENTPHPLIGHMSKCNESRNMGGTMRLGSYECSLSPGSKTAQIYGTESIFERHRHRFEFNNAYRERIESAGLTTSGVWEEKNVVEVIELEGHPFYIGTQFHPEFKSRPNRPHPLFREFIKKAVEHNLKKTTD